MSNRTTFLLGVLLTIACSGGSDTATRSVTRDSAGITIVENEAPVWTDGVGWRVEPEPALDIGVADGEPPYEFAYIYATARLPDGRIVVTDQGSHEVRFFASDGRFLHVVGGEGAGPGEFGQVGPISLIRGDSIVVYDHDLNRVNVLDPEGRFSRVFPMRLSQALLSQTRVRPTGIVNYWINGTIEDSLFFVYSPGEDSRPRQVDGTYWDSTSIILMSADGERLTNLGRWPVGQNVGATPANPSPMPQFFPRMVLALTSDHFWYGTSERYEVREYRADGSLSRIVRRRHRPVPITADFIADFEDRFIEYMRTSPAEPVPEDRLVAMRQRLRDNAVYAPARPAFSWMLADDIGNLWIREYTHYSEAEGPWTVFDTEGRWLGQVELPQGLRVSQIGDDFVIGVARDELGVEHVRVHRLLKD